MTQFTDLGLAEPILKALAAEGYETPTPIQEQAIPVLLEGRDLLGTAQTGTGKTAAFTLPILNMLATSDLRAKPKSCTALILAPTRELALQIAESVKTYGKQVRPRFAVVMGGVKPGGQIRAMQGGVDILIATPGRLLDHMKTGVINLDSVKTVVLDEADQMMDLGFLPGIRRILMSTPQGRQTALLSATMPKQIRGLAHDFLNDPAQLSVAPVSRPIEQIDQSVQFLEKSQKLERLVKVLTENPVTSAIVFTRTKHGADKVCRRLNQADLRAVAIHGNKSQNQRQRALDGFKAFRSNILVATDIAARGLDIDGVSHVVNYELPNVPESYVHRIGRTARAGKSGTAIAFCDREERGLLKDIERLIGYRLAVTDDRGDVEHPSKPFTEQPRGAQPGGGKPNAGGQRNKPRQPRPDYRGDDRRNREPELEDIMAQQPRTGRKPSEDGEYRSRADRPRGDRPDSGKPHGRPGSKFRGGKPNGKFHGDRDQDRRQDSDRKPAERVQGGSPQAKPDGQFRNKTRPDQKGGDRRKTGPVFDDARAQHARTERKPEAEGEYRGRADRPRSEGSYSGKPRPGKPQGRPEGQFRGGKPKGKFHGDRDQDRRRDGDRKSEDRAQGGRPQGKPARDERPRADRPNTDRPKSLKPKHQGSGAKPGKPGNDNRRRDGNKTGLDRMLDGSGGIRRRNSRSGGPGRRSA
ncbi:DEAD/DEAH box helicase [Hyphobacterium sp. HN65]|uniref:DEAD/DEAH box helicase n=1 Tax=Hyphobacterium lacteum TaxID=3116575 RepID=A0ABU7LSL7_9PROT|nr:DEAD/DEAH box helicase [Hyphobacterium sp. HN65]MEE2526882.1 DEAD/DEAH box helicase [Hyphobacterium sp. HN65]